MYCIKVNDEIKFGPSVYVASLVASQLASIGLNVSLPDNEPTEDIAFGDVVNVVLVHLNEGIQPSCDVYQTISTSVDGGNVQWVVADISINQAKATAISKIAELRYQYETGGVVVGGRTVSTARDSQSMISGAFCYSLASPDTLVQFKTLNGWVSLTSEEIKGIALVVGNHVQHCFAVEKTHCDNINALSDVEAIRVYMSQNANQGW